MIFSALFGTWSWYEFVDIYYLVKYFVATT